jgi:hypothetical protein
VTRRTEGKRAAGRAQDLAYWLIARNGHGRIEVLTLEGKKILPVFSNENEAEMFLQLKVWLTAGRSVRAEAVSSSRCSMGFVRA